MKRVLRDYPAFRAFLTDSTFGHIRLGIPATNVLSHLSEPHLPYWEATYQNESTPMLAIFEAYGRHWQAWYCGNLEFVTVDDHIFKFNINLYKRLQIPRAFNVKWHRLFFLTPLQELIELLKEWEISHQFLMLDIAPEEVMVVLPLSVEGNIIFHFENANRFPWRITVTRSALADIWASTYQLHDQLPSSLL